MTRIGILGSIMAGGLFVVLSNTSVYSAGAETDDASASPITIPNFTGFWARNSGVMELFQPSTGPGGLVNTSGVRLQGIANYDSPILKPWASDVVRHHGEIIRSGELAPDANASCFPLAGSYSLIIRGNIQLLQEPDRVTIIYESDHQFRTVFLNREHSEDFVPTYFGESVGRYEGDTLVVDTIGIRVTQFSAVDRFGTPHTEEMHMIERYKIVEGNRGLELRADLTVEDPGTFTIPWGGYMIYYRSDETWWEEYRCAENNRSGIWIPTDEDHEPPL